MLRPRGLSGVSGQEELQARYPAQHFSMMPREGWHVRLGGVCRARWGAQAWGRVGGGGPSALLHPLLWTDSTCELHLVAAWGHPQVAKPENQSRASSCLFWALHLPAWEQVVPGLCLGGVMSGH